jgi:hypothetical protein
MGLASLCECPQYIFAEKALGNTQTPISHFHSDPPERTKAMKTTLTSNWRPLLRALYAFLITIAVLWAMPRTAHAQLYVTSTPGGGLIGVVSKYDAKTGDLINANFIAGLNFPAGLAVKGNTLFVANDAFAATAGTVGKYDAKTGAAISPSFITGLSDSRCWATPSSW